MSSFLRGLFGGSPTPDSPGDGAAKPPASQVGA